MENSPIQNSSDDTVMLMCSIYQRVDKETPGTL